MKNRIAKLFVVALMLQSCAHTARYVESSYDCNDSPYPIASMTFAYNVAGKGIPENLAKLGDKIHNDVKSDSHYQEMLPSAIKLVDNGDTKRAGLETALSKANNLSFNVNGSHANAIKQIKEIQGELSEYKKVDLSENFKRDYQLSHRGIIQHHVNNSIEFKGLNKTEQELVYGYILKKDIESCEKLAKAKVNDYARKLDNAENAVAIIKGKQESMVHQEEEQSISTEKCVDLGLSVYWCGYNFGTSTPEKFGEWYVWGETEVKRGPGNYDTKYYKKDYERFNAYYGTRNEVTFEDVVSQTWGNGWQIPKKEHVEELMEKCKFYPFTYKKIKGYKVVGPNGKSIFMPADRGTLSIYAGESRYEGLKYLLSSPHLYKSEKAGGKMIPDISSGTCLELNVKEKKISIEGITRDNTGEAGVIRPVKRK